jgi:DNA-binding protein YbaB
MDQNIVSIFSQLFKNATERNNAVQFDGQSGPFKLVINGNKEIIHCECDASLIAPDLNEEGLVYLNGIMSHLMPAIVEAYRDAVKKSDDEIAKAMSSFASESVA